MNATSLLIIRFDIDTSKALVYSLRVPTYLSTDLTIMVVNILVGS